MRTARLLPVSPSMHCLWGGLYLVPGGVSGPGEVPGSGGMYLVPGGVPVQVPPLWTEFLTHTSENITLPKTLFAGGNNFYSYTGNCTVT